MQAADAPAPGVLARALSALEHRNYRWYWISGLGNTAAQGIKQLALAWLVLDLTDSVGQLGIVIFMQGAPMAVIAIYGGVLADRYDRRFLLIASQALTAFNLVLLAVLVMAGTLALWQVYASSISLGVAQSITQPARLAYIRTLVPREVIMNAVALNSIQMQASRIVWPSIAGVLIATSGIGATLIVNASCLVLGIGGLLLIHESNEPVPQRLTSPMRDLVDGLRYTISNPTVFSLVTLGFAVGLLGMPFLQMTPGFARQELGFNASETGFLVMASGVGAVLGSAYLLLVDVQNKVRFFVFLLFLLSFSLIALALNPWDKAAFAIMVVVGLAGLTQAVVANTLFQLFVPSQYLGRVVSLWGAAGGLISVAALPIGLVGEEWGLRWGLGGAGALLIPITIWLGLIRRPLREMPEAAADLPQGERQPVAAVPTA